MILILKVSKIKKNSFNINIEGYLFNKKKKSFLRIKLIRKFKKKNEPKYRISVTKGSYLYILKKKLIINKETLFY
jgi:hypothetical protein